MKKPFYVAFAAALALLSGCIVYQMDKTPPCDGLSDAAKAECKFKPKCLLKCEPLNPKANLALCEGMPQEVLDAMQYNVIMDAVSNGGHLHSVQKDDGRVLERDQVRIRIERALSRESGSDMAFLLCALSIGLCPTHMATYHCPLEFSVEDGCGRSALYAFDEKIDLWGGWFALAVKPFCDEVSFKEVFEAVNRKTLDSLFVKMQQDGFFSAEGRDKAAAAKADAVETLKKNAAARRKELEDLKKAGIIDEAEFAAEVKKLEGAGK